MKGGVSLFTYLLKLLKLLKVDTLLVYRRLIGIKGDDQPTTSAFTLGGQMGGNIRISNAGQSSIARGM